MAEHGDEWSADEINAAVDAYANLLEKGVHGNSTQRELAIKYLLKALPGRNEASALMRMGNISAVLDSYEAEWITAWKPRRNVGPTNTQRISDQLRTRGII